MHILKTFIKKKWPRIDNQQLPVIYVGIHMTS